ncbi:MAG TPA: hypothetical protein VFJ98_05885 [Mycobacteriales bacterium]|nr:hypothetical protein [Mycobacteriales bacterium]
MLTAANVPSELSDGRNREGHRDFDVHWRWADGPTAPGLTAVLRVRNEAANLPYVLPPLLDALRAVIVVDNGSTDDTAGTARRVADEAAAGDRLTVLDYPFAVARCGPEHLATPADSVHSLAYFYNWSFSHVSTSYALKWDGDMVPTTRGVRALRDLEWQLEPVDRILHLRHRPLYVRDASTAFVDTELRHPEPCGWPNRPGYRYVKAFEWETLLWPKGPRPLVGADWSCLEIKRLDQEEFAHWSTDDFERSKRTRRKRREVSVFTTLARGDDPPRGVVRIDAPDGVDVIDYARTRWLADHRAGLDQLAEEPSEPA